MVSFPAKGKVGARCCCDYNAEQKSRKNFDRFLGSCGISIMKGEVVSSEKRKEFKMYDGINNVCPVCGGRGYVRQQCEKCYGLGYREHEDSNGNPVRDYCDKCGGDGQVDKECSCRQW